MKLIIGTIALAMSALSAAAQNSPACDESDSIRAALAAGYGEVRRVVGLTPAGTIIELYASESGSWTLLETSASGMSCIKGAGQMFMIIGDEDEGA